MNTHYTGIFKNDFEVGNSIYACTYILIIVIIIVCMLPKPGPKSLSIK